MHKGLGTYVIAEVPKSKEKRVAFFHLKEQSKKAPMVWQKRIKAAATAVFSK